MKKLGYALFVFYVLSIVIVLILDEHGKEDIWATIWGGWVFPLMALVFNLGKIIDGDELLMSPAYFIPFVGFFITYTLVNKLQKNKTSSKEESLEDENKRLKEELAKLEKEKEF